MEKLIYKLHKSSPLHLKAHVKMLRGLKPVSPELGKWYDAKKFKPEIAGRYLVILESRSPNEGSQSFSGIGEPEMANYNEKFDTSPLSNWSCRGSLHVAFFSKITDFNMKWEFNPFGTGQFI